MKFSTRNIPQGKLILANDHYVAIPYDCTNLASLATDGVIKAGTVIPANNATAKGVLFTDVILAENPNGTIVVHGFIKNDKLPAVVAAEAKSALTQIVFVD